MQKVLPSFFLLMVIILSAVSYEQPKEPIPGAYQVELYAPSIADKSVAIVANQTSVIGKIHLVDNLHGIGINIKKIFAPEHGFRGMAEAGEAIANGKDPQTGIPLISLYGTHLKPSQDDLRGIDIVLFDIQDVGVRFYTYISTLHYVIEACAENGVKCIILDRPNPNGFYFDGNIADTDYHSFVAMDPVPIVYGMTIGEYAIMINGEGWLKNGVKCDLTVIKCKDYTHKTLYKLPVKPSPNLPDMTSVYLYPSICFFEGTNISLGRGTAYPFQIFGSPKLPDHGFTFTPQSLPDSKNPPLLGEVCYGIDLRNAIKDKLVPSKKINLEWITGAFLDYPEKDKFFTPYFDVLAAGPTLREQIQKGMNSEEIRTTWQDGLVKFGKIRSKYLLYK